MNLRNRWPVLPIVAGPASGVLTGCGTEKGASGADGSHVVVGMSDDVLATDPASGYPEGANEPPAGRRRALRLLGNRHQGLHPHPAGRAEVQQRRPAGPTPSWCALPVAPGYCAPGRTSPLS